MISKIKSNDMRKIIVMSMISLDGVMQAPGGPEEDTSNGFKYGGWTASYQDEVGGNSFQKMMAPADLLLGRKTFEIFANYWPEHEKFWPGIMDVNKYFLSNTLKESDAIVTRWKNSNVLNNLTDIQKLKNSKGADLKVWGSSDLVQLLIKNDLVDELWLVTYPLTLGKGKKLFNDSAIPAAFTLAESVVTTKGVLIANYKRAGEVKTGTVGV
jgi:dihydrofolate reductase